MGATSTFRAVGILPRALSVRFSKPICRFASVEGSNAYRFNVSEGSIVVDEDVSIEAGLAVTGVLRAFGVDAPETAVVFQTVDLPDASVEGYTPFIAKATGTIVHMDSVSWSTDGSFGDADHIFVYVHNHISSWTEHYLDVNPGTGNTLAAGHTDSVEFLFDPAESYPRNLALCPITKGELKWLWNYPGASSITGPVHLSVVIGIAATT